MQKSRDNFGLQSLEKNINRVLKPIFNGSKKEFILINNLVKNWSEIVGPKYEQFCYPKSVTFSKKIENQGKLVISVFNPAIGFFIEQNSEIIQERIASFYGFKAINKIIIKQEPKMLESEEEEVELEEEKEEFLNKTLSDVDDKELSETLKKLGRFVFKN